jgi:hypothetical protein
MTRQHLLSQLASHYSPCSLSLVVMASQVLAKADFSFHGFY